VLANGGVQIEGAAVSITTDAGDTGVTETYQSGGKAGRLAAFTFPAGGALSGPIGIAFTIDGPGTTLAQYEPEIDTMLQSVSLKAGS
jgi:hypothetical protein